MTDSLWPFGRWGGPGMVGNMAINESGPFARRWHEQAHDRFRAPPKRRASAWSRCWILLVATLTAPIYLLFLVLGALIYPFVQAWPGEQE